MVPGLFDSTIEAARAHDEYIVRNNLCTNFPLNFSAVSKKRKQPLSEEYDSDHAEDCHNNDTMVHLYGPENETIVKETRNKQFLSNQERLLNRFAELKRTRDIEQGPLI